MIVRRVARALLLGLLFAVWLSVSLTAFGLAGDTVQWLLDGRGLRVLGLWLFIAGAAPVALVLGSSGIEYSARILADFHGLGGGAAEHKVCVVLPVFLWLQYAKGGASLSTPELQAIEPKEPGEPTFSADPFAFIFLFLSVGFGLLASIVIVPVWNYILRFIFIVLFAVGVFAWSLVKFMYHLLWNLGPASVVSACVGGIPLCTRDLTVRNSVPKLIRDSVVPIPDTDLRRVRFMSKVIEVAAPVTLLVFCWALASERLIDLKLSLIPLKYLAHGSIGLALTLLTILAGRLACRGLKQV